MAKKIALEQFHRDVIATAADKLFLEKGVDKATMDDIAKAAEYSKATLYVYFKSKDEILYYITLRGMRLLHDRFTQVLAQNIGAIEQYLAICEILAEFYDQYPLCFQSMLMTIASDLESRTQSEFLEAIYQVGEILNDDIAVLIQTGVGEGVFKDGLPCLSTGLVYWAALSGIVSFAGNKQSYISDRVGITKNDFRKFGFETILQSLLKHSD